MPPNNNPSPTYGTQLAGEILGTPLQEWVQERRDAGKSWDTISVDLAIATESRVRYSGEHLRRLFKPANGAAA